MADRVRRRSGHCLKTAEAMDTAPALNMPGPGGRSGRYEIGNSTKLNASTDGAAMRTLPPSCWTLCPANAKGSVRSAGAKKNQPGYRNRPPGVQRSRSPNGNGAAAPNAVTSQTRQKSRGIRTPSRLSLTSFQRTLAYLVRKPTDFLQLYNISTDRGCIEVLAPGIQRPRMTHYVAWRPAPRSLSVLVCIARPSVTVTERKQRAEGNDSTGRCATHMLTTIAPLHRFALD